MRAFPLLLVTVCFIAASLDGQVLYNSGGFEPPRFVPGNLAGQDNTPPGPWFKDSGTSTAVIQTATTNGGTQAVRMDRTGSASGDTRWGAQTPFTPSAGNILRVVFDLNVLQASTPPGSFGPAFGVELYGRSAGNALLLLGSVTVDATTGDVLYQTQGNGFLTESGTVVARGSFNQFAITANFTALTYTIFLNGVPLHTEGFVDSGFATFSDADLSTFAAAGDPGSQNATGTAFFDNYRVEIIPEPGTLTLWLLGASAVAGWQRRRR